MANPDDRLRTDSRPFLELSWVHRCARGPHQRLVEDREGEEEGKEAMVEAQRALRTPLIRALWRAPWSAPLVETVETLVEGREELVEGREAPTPSRAVRKAFPTPARWRRHHRHES